MATYLRSASTLSRTRKPAPARAERLDAYASRGYKQVRGYLERAAVILIRAVAEAQDAFEVHGNVAEIGVHQGRGFILLQLLARAEERGVAVDVFGHQDLNLDDSGRGDLAIFKQNLRRHIGTEAGVAIIEGDSTKLTAEDYEAAAGGKFRLFHVDGGHMAHMAKHDMLQAYRSLAGGGVIILDDYFHEQWPGVSDGVRELFAEQPDIDLAPFGIGGNKVFFAQKAWAPKYREYLAALPVDRQGYGKPTVMMGHDVLTFAFWDMNLKDRLIRTDVWKQVRGKPPFVQVRRALRKRQGRKTSV
ncbi:MAG: class I SAM-dependent methyltransferase [Hyphomicrobiales bacterium]